MRRFIKVLFILFCLFLAVLIGSAAALRVAYPPEKIKKIVLREISLKFGRELQVEDVSLNLFTGIKLSGFKCSEKPNFKAGNFLECGNFSLGIAWLPLLQKRIEIDSLKLELPKIHIERDENGKTYNFSDLLSPSMAPGPSRLQAKSPFRFQVSKIKIVNGSLDFEDRSPENKSGSIQSFNLSIRGTSFQKPLKVELSTRIDLKKPVREIPIKGELQFLGIISPFSQEVKIEKLQWKSADLVEVKASGFVKHFSKPMFDLNLEIAHARLLPFARLGAFPSLTLKGDAAVKLEVKGELDLDRLKETGVRLGNLEIQSSFNLNESEIEWAPTFQKKKGEKLDFSWNGKWVGNSLEGETIEWSLAALHFRELGLESSGKISNIFSHPKLSLTVKNVSLPWSELSSLLKPWLLKDAGLSGTMSLEGSLTGDMEDLTVKGVLNATKSELNFPGLFHKGSDQPFQIEVEGALRNKNSLTVQRLNVNVQGSQFQISGNVENLKTPLPKLSGEIQVLKLDWDTLGFLGLPKEISMKGIAHGHAALSGTKEEFLFSGEANLNDSEIFLPNKFQKPKGVPFALHLEDGKNLKEAISVGKYNLLLGKMNFKGDAQIRGVSSPQKTFRASLHSNSPVDLKEVSGFAPGLKGVESGSLDMNISLSGSFPMNLLPKIDGNASVKNLSGTVREVSLKNVNAEFAFLPTQQFKGKITIKELAHRNFESGNISLDWDLNDLNPQLDKVSGTAKLRTFGGEAKNIGSVEKFLKIINPSLSLLEFTDIGGDFMFKSGTLHIKDFWVESDQLHIETEGSLLLSSKTSDLRVLAHYTGGALAVEVPITITGSLTSPKIEKKGISILTQTLQEKLLRKRVKTKEEQAIDKEMKEEKKLEKVEDKKLEIEQKSEQKKEKQTLKVEEKKEKEELKKQELDEKEEQQKAKEEEKAERLKQKEEERLERIKEKEELKHQKEESE